MLCPHCGYPKSRVVDSRGIAGESRIRRRRACIKCGKRWSTVEIDVLDYIPEGVGIRKMLTTLTDARNAIEAFIDSSGDVTT